ncbi:MAG: NADPH:quinone reductase [Burkholderiales bacterium RIFCSPLOWO2_02_FULL_57_36]|nr:MAG: NADPH:quinone reductase [Burkholderiales bacterium RIFCSPLOWO2_02_FULL_57_36]
MGKKILVVLGHPSSDSYCGSLADTYAEAARQAGTEVRKIHLGELDFDPVLHEGYTRIQALEPDLVAAQEAFAWAEHLVFVYPIWWGAMPALMKGFIDRIFLPGFAFKYRPNSSLWDKLLAGRSAHLLVTMDAPPWYFKWINRMPGHNQMKKTILEFSGIKPVRISSFGPVIGSSAAQREKWAAKVQQFGLDANAM